MKRALRWAFLAVALILLGWALIARWDQVADALASITWGALAAALAAAVVALLINAMSWRAVMRAVGLDVHPREALRVFLLSQIGKYVPGSVWPVIAQAEMARDHGVSRARAMTGSVVAMVVGVVTSSIVGFAALVAVVPGAIAEYWWVAPVCVALATLLVPAVLARVVRLAFRVTRRQEAPARIGGRAIVASVAWSTLMWVVLGVHAWLLLRELVPGASLILATGAFAFAWLVGFLVVIAPAGAGVREAVLVVALGGVATPGQALAFAVVSRFLMTVADVIGLGIGVMARGNPRGAAVQAPPRPPAHRSGRTAAP